MLADFRSLNCWHCSVMKRMQKTNWFRQTSVMLIWKGLWTDQTWLWNARVLHQRILYYLSKGQAGRWSFPPKVLEACSPLSPVEDMGIMLSTVASYRVLMIPTQRAAEDWVLVQGSCFWRLISWKYRWWLLFGNMDGSLGAADSLFFAMFQVPRNVFFKGFLAEPCFGSRAVKHHWMQMGGIIDYWLEYFLIILQHILSV